MLARAPALALVSALLASPGSACVIIDGDDDGNDAATDDGPQMEGDGDTGEGVCFTPPHCDPLSPSCGDGELCSGAQGTFDCTPVPEGSELVGEGEECGTASCQEGLVCVPGMCGVLGCCVPLCDLEQPQCPDGRACIPYFSEGSSQCYAHVGACEPQ